MQATGSRSFLSQFAVARKPSEPIPGEYSEELRMWAVETEVGLRPIIEADKNLSEITTKTRVNQESDDTHVSLLEIQTKTAENQEQDDQIKYGGSALLEITTKTDAQLERDDTSPGVLGFL